jgi:Mn2+/Fe2+ NRAMP family transporter
MSETSQLFLKGSFFGRYSLWLLIAAAGGVVVLLVFLNQLKVLVDMATILSFLVAPIVAYLNYKLVNSTSISEGSKPSKLLNYWALAGILFLTGFAMLYLVTVFSS